MPRANAISDWHTLSNHNDITSTHIHLNLKVDFQQRQLRGSIEHTLKKHNPSVNQLSLDTRELEISDVKILSEEKWITAHFELAKEDKVRGSQLNINLTPETTRVRVYYHTSPNASGLQWLTPEQTAGKKFPFMFSQSQAIHSRSWMPIQDTPAMRLTYSAQITTDKNMRPVMSANNAPARNSSGTYHFEMPQPIPPYLIAIAAGDIHHKSMSAQTAIYAESAYLDSASKEFEDTQAMIEASEEMYGKYRWNQYDLLILPPSFPFGGMENPRLSFITPTVIAGDKSLVSLIAHELAHSWSGNLVTNATWRDLWLNEGFTSYVENRIMEKIFGKDRAIMEQALSVQSLKKELKTLAKEDTILHVQMNNRDPDDAFSDIPYVKGQLFLIFLEQRFGRKIFDSFVRQYFDDHAFQSIDTPTFIQYLNQNLILAHPGKVTLDEVNEWILAPYLPTTSPNPESDAFNKVEEYIDNWLKNNASPNKMPTSQWTVHEWLYFVNNLPLDISRKRLSQLDKTFGLTQSTNNEIAHAWLLLGIKRQYQPINKRLESYLISIGRRKLITPLYEELAKRKEDLIIAQSIYKKARSGYHPMAQVTIDKILNNKETN